MQYLRIHADIDLDAACHNLRQVRRQIGPDPKLLAVIKADGYGHGSVPLAHSFLSEGLADYFGVATLEEAVELRRSGIKTPILILGYTSPSQFEEVIGYHLTQTVYTYEAALGLSQTAQRAGKQAIAHLALETGMGRIGFWDSMESVGVIQKIAALPYLKLEGMFSHFSKADEQDLTYAKGQLERYLAFDRQLKAAGVFIPLRHLCNSAGIMALPEQGFEMVRSGIITYGLYPSEEVPKNVLDIRPVMSFKAHVIHTKMVEAGYCISYGGTYRTTRPTCVATLSVGYADGYPRAISNKGGRVLIHGQYAPILGRICMDQMMVDVTHIPQVQVEDEAVLIGTQGENCIPAEEIASLAGTINYEITCQISRRVPRIYWKNGQIQQVIERVAP